MVRSGNAFLADDLRATSRCGVERRVSVVPMMPSSTTAGANSRSRVGNPATDSAHQVKGDHVMGCYDSVQVPCPKCGTISEFQTKSGECTLETYPLASAPWAVMEDVNRHTPNKCQKCGCWFGVDIEQRKTVELPEAAALRMKEEKSKRFRERLDAACKDSAESVGKA